MRGTPLIRGAKVNADNISTIIQGRQCVVPFASTAEVGFAEDQSGLPREPKLPPSLKL